MNGNDNNGNGKAMSKADNEIEKTISPLTPPPLGRLQRHVRHSSAHGRSEAPDLWQ